MCNSEDKLPFNSINPPDRNGSYITNLMTYCRKHSSANSPWSELGWSKRSDRMVIYIQNKNWFSWGGCLRKWMEWEVTGMVFRYNQDMEMSLKFLNGLLKVINNFNFSKRFADRIETNRSSKYPSRWRTLDGKRNLWAAS